jgi:hypothetical protein
MYEQRIEGKVRLVHSDSDGWMVSTVSAQFLSWDRMEGLPYGDEMIHSKLGPDGKLVRVPA